MSRINKSPELGENNEILHFINIYNEDGEFKVELDEDGNIKTNINRLIDNIVSYNNEGTVVKIDHDLYSKLNSTIEYITLTCNIHVQKTLENLYK